MSIDISFYTKITLTEVKEKTSLTIVEDNGQTFIKDNKGNVCYVKKGVFTFEDSDLIDEDSFELTSYGMNNPSFILKELVEIFNLKFLLDDDQERLYHENIVNFDEYLDSCMKRYFP